MTDLARTSARRLTLLSIALAIAGLTLPGVASAQTVKGAITNGANHTGTIAASETHVWTLAANAGEAIVLSVGEVGATDSPFTPWIGLYTQANVYVTSSYGTLTGHINVNAPSTRDLQRLHHQRHRCHERPRPAATC